MDKFLDNDSFVTGGYKIKTLVSKNMFIIYNKTMMFYKIKGNLLGVIVGKRISNGNFNAKTAITTKNNSNNNNINKSTALQITNSSTVHNRIPHIIHK
jgi:hypothetical protein